MINPINIFLLCHNESILLPHTICHYRYFMPSAIITIYDNESSDNSKEIAISMGCNVVTWSSNNILDDYLNKEIKNNCWKNVSEGWIIVADMDEWLCIFDHELDYEKNSGTTILQIKGWDIVGESNTVDLTDVDIHSIKKYFPNEALDKNICFLREKITDMNYTLGSHKCFPCGIVQFSSENYVLKHMSHLGLPFLINKILKRYERTELMRSKGLAIHYTNNIENVKSYYLCCLSNCKVFTNNYNKKIEMLL